VYQITDLLFIIIIGAGITVLLGLKTRTCWNNIHFLSKEMYNLQCRTVYSTFSSGMYYLTPWCRVLLEEADIFSSHQ
jgi:hypothetical protein